MCSAVQVYAAVFEGGMGYRRENTSGVAVGDEPESMCAAGRAVGVGGRSGPAGLWSGPSEAFQAFGVSTEY